MSVSNEFLRPNQDGRFYAQQSQLLRGLWTPYGVLSPMFIGAWPDGSLAITYSMQRGASFTKEQKRKIKYVERRGVKVTIMHPEDSADA